MLLNEWMNCEWIVWFVSRTWNPRISPGCILRRSMMFIPLGADSTVRKWAIIQLLAEWGILAQAITGYSWFFSQRALHGVHSSCCRRCVVLWSEHMRCPCVYCLCLAGQVLFSTRAPVKSLTTANEQRTYTRILSPSSMWRTPATESQYLFYRMGWVNPESESTT